MHTIIVPIDFSDTSKNAARFAANVAAQVQDAQIILYNVFDKIETGSDGSVLADEPEARQKIMELALESVKTEMLSVGSPNLRISFIAEEESSFIDSLERIARHQKADLIIMGITGSTKLEQIFMGSNTLKIVDKNVCPVMIVPPDAIYKGIKKVVFATDFKDIDKATPTMSIRAILDMFRPEVHVVNVDSDHYVEVTEEYKEQRGKLEKILAGYKTEFYFIRLYDFIDAISQFTADKDIDLILTVPKNHSFLTNLFKTSHTKKLAYHSHVPIVAIHE